MLAGLKHTAVGKGLPLALVVVASSVSPIISSMLGVDLETLPDLLKESFKTGMEETYSP